MESEILEFAWIEGNNFTQPKIVLRVAIHKEYLKKAIEVHSLEGTVRIAQESIESYIYQTLTPNFKGSIKSKTEIVKDILNENEK